MKKILLFILSGLTLCLNSKSQTFSILQSPPNCFGFQEVWCGTNTYNSYVFIHSPKYQGYRSEDGGTTWTEMGCGLPISADCDCGNKTCYNYFSFQRQAWSTDCPGHGLAIGDNGLIKETFDFGDSWNNMESQYCTLPSNNLLKCQSNNGYIYIVGESGYYMLGKMPGCDPCEFASCETYIQDPNKDLFGISSDGYHFCGQGGYVGSYWNSGIPCPTQEDLYGIVGDNSIMIAVGAHGTIVKFVNIWTTTFPTITGVQNMSTINLNGVSQTVMGTYYAVGDQGLILKSTDGGDNWSPIACPTHENLRGIDINENTIYVVGDNNTIMKASY